VADGGQRVARGAPLQLARGGKHQPSAARAERVTQGDGAAIDVESILTNSELFLPGQAHWCECLVDLEQVNVVGRQPGALQDFARGWDRAGEHRHRVRTDLAEGDEARQWLQSNLLGLLP